jgi:hypothetical protein
MRIIVVSLVADFIALNLLYECVNVVRYGSHFWLQEKMCIKKEKGGGSQFRRTMLNSEGCRKGFVGGVETGWVLTIAT